MSTPPTRRTGGRSARITRAVHAATLQALTELGVDGLTVEAVAVRAGVNKTTIYRRWGTRGALLADALGALSAAQITVPATGSVRGDLVAFARQVRDALVAPASRGLLAALAAGAHRGELAEVGRRYWAGRLAAARPLVDRAIARGELPPGLDPDAFVVRVVGPVWFAVFGPGLAVDDAFVDGCVDAALRGAARPRADSVADGIDSAACQSKPRPGRSTG